MSYRPLTPMLLVATCWAVACSQTPDRPASVRVVADAGISTSDGGPNPLCGNSVIDPGETCDKALGVGLGACPPRCFDGLSCTQDRQTGSAEQCDIQCAFDPITSCVNDDGCCPAGCAVGTDNDCSGTCGNGMTDPLESCDGNCPVSCDDRSACTVDSQYGAASTCSLNCGHELVSACTSGDGCCPQGCTNAEDNDCSSSCGDGVIDQGETCDGNCPSDCDDGSACTLDVLVGNASSCNVECVHLANTQCNSDDGCCPAGCTSANDNDCSASCGNGTVDPGETCDGNCTVCPAPMACQMVSTSGSPANCNVSCTITAISICRSSDGCCPAGCNPGNDADCAQPPVQGIGDACTSSDCNTGNLSCQDNTGWPAGYCTETCSGPCPSGSTCSFGAPGLTWSPPMCLKTCTGNADCRTPSYACTSAYSLNETLFDACLPVVP